MNFRVPLYALGLVATVTLACAVMSPSATLTPLATDVSTTPTPAGGQLGGLEGIYATTYVGGIDETCHTLFRFFQNGVVLMERSYCTKATQVAEIVPTLEQGLQPGSPSVGQGNYYTLDRQLWLTVTLNNADAAHSTRLFDVRGTVCGGQMALQQLHLYSADYVSDTFNVPLYTRLDVAPLATGTLTEASTCHVAPFRLLNPLPVKPGESVDLYVQTVAGEPCQLSFTEPNGVESEAEGLGIVTADDQGVCHWVWQTSPTVQPGTGKATITVDGLSGVGAVYIVP